MQRYTVLTITRAMAPRDTNLTTLVSICLRKPGAPAAFTSCCFASGVGYAGTSNGAAEAALAVGMRRPRVHGARAT